RREERRVIAEAHVECPQRAPGKVRHGQPHVHRPPTRHSDGRRKHHKQCCGDHRAGTTAEYPQCSHHDVPINSATHPCLLSHRHSPCHRTTTAVRARTALSCTARHTPARRLPSRGRR